MVNVKMGTALLAGSSLLKQKERADELFVEEVRFLRSCFLESPEKAKQLTQLRIAKLVKPSILENYEMIRDVEPDIRYQSVPIRSFFHVAASKRLLSALSQSRTRPFCLLGASLCPRHVRTSLKNVSRTRRRACLAGTSSPDRQQAFAGADQQLLGSLLEVSLLQSRQIGV